MLHPLNIVISAHDRLSPKLATVSRKIGVFGTKLKTTGAKLNTNFTLPAAFAGGAVIKMGADFEQSMNRAAAVTGAIGEENVDKFDAMRKAAKHWGKQTEFSATEAAQAMQFLGMAGLKSGEVIEALPGTLNLATVAQIELAEAADIATNILTGYGKEVGDLAGVNDVLTATFTKSNTSLTELGDAFKFAGPIASQMGLKFSETSAILGKFADSGIKGTLAGTTLRRALVQLAKITPAGTAVFQKFKIKPADFKNSKGQIGSLVGVLKKLDKAGANVEDFIDIFGVRAGPNMAKLIGKSLPKLEKLQADIEGAGNITERVSKVFRSGASGAMKTFMSAIEALAISIGESGVLQAFTNLTNRASAVIREWSTASPETLKFAATVGILTAVVGPLIVAVGVLAGSFVTVASAANFVLIKFAGFILLKTVALAFGAVAGAVRILTLAFTTFGLAGPLILITGLTYAAVKLYQNWDWVSEKLGGIFKFIGSAIAGFVKFALDKLNVLFGIGDKIRSLGGLIGGLSKYIFGENKTEKKKIPIMEPNFGLSGAGTQRKPGSQVSPAGTKSTNFIATGQNVGSQAPVMAKPVGEIKISIDSKEKGVRVETTKAENLDLETVLKTGRISK